jgi:hypothetical protein
MTFTVTHSGHTFANADAPASGDFREPSTLEARTDGRLDLTVVLALMAGYATGPHRQERDPDVPRDPPSRHIRSRLTGGVQDMRAITGGPAIVHAGLGHHRPGGPQRRGLVNRIGWSTGRTCAALVLGGRSGSVGMRIEW